MESTKATKQMTLSVKPQQITSATDFTTIANPLAKPNSTKQSARLQKH
jgi:hypothetical protein